MTHTKHGCITGAAVGLLVCSLAGQSTRTMALTFDDLPYTGDNATLANIQQVTQKLTSALEAAEAPSVALVNESRLEVPGENEARLATLQRWIDAGAMLGNHTYSHVDFNNTTIDSFQAQITRGEIASRRLMQSRAPYRLYFRHPYTHTGDTAEKKQAIAQFLTARGYTIAPHTIDNQDFVFNGPYGRAIRAGNDELANRVRVAYLAFTFATP